MKLKIIIGCISLILFSAFKPESQYSKFSKYVNQFPEINLPYKTRPMDELLQTIDITCNPLNVDDSLYVSSAAFPSAYWRIEPYPLGMYKYNDVYILLIRILGDCENGSSIIPSIELCTYYKEKMVSRITIEGGYCGEYNQTYYESKIENDSTIKLVEAYKDFDSINAIRILDSMDRYEKNYHIDPVGNIILTDSVFVLPNFSQNEIKNRTDSIKIICLRDTIKYRIDQASIDYSIPDIGGLNENSFFNKTITENFLDEFSIDGSGTVKANNPKDFLKEIIQRKKIDITNSSDGYIGDLYTSNYDVTYNQYPFLSITMNYEVIGASYSFDKSYFNFDIQNHTILKMEDIIQKQKMPMLLDTINQILKLRVLAYEKDSTENNKEQEDSNYTQYLLERISDSYPDGKYFTPYNFNAFQLKEKGIWIYYDYDLYRVTSCPDWNLFFTYEELKPYIKKEFKQRMGL